MTEILEALHSLVVAKDHQQGKIVVEVEVHMQILDGLWPDSFRMFPDDSKNFVNLSSSFAAAEDSYKFTEKEQIR